VQFDAVIAQSSTTPPVPCHCEESADPFDKLRAGVAIITFPSKSVPPSASGFLGMTVDPPFRR